MTGKGLQADSTGSANTTAFYVPDTTNGHGMINPYPYMSPPFFLEHRTTGIAARQEQSIQFNPNSRNNSIKFINKPLSNIDFTMGQTIGNKILQGYLQPRQFITKNTQIGNRNN